MAKHSDYESQSLLLRGNYLQIHTQRSLSLL